MYRPKKKETNSRGSDSKKSWKNDKSIRQNIDVIYSYPKYLSHTFKKSVFFFQGVPLSSLKRGGTNIIPTHDSFLMCESIARCQMSILEINASNMCKIAMTKQL